MTPEQAAHKALQKEMGGLWHYQRHEDKFSPDVPDMSFAYSGHHGWIELKAAITGEAIKLRPGQINWMVKRGGHVYLVIRELNKDKSHSRWVGVHGGAIREFQCAGRIVSRDVAEHPLAISGESFKGVLEALLRQTSLSVASRASGY